MGTKLASVQREARVRNGLPPDAEPGFLNSMFGGGGHSHAGHSHDHGHSHEAYQQNGNGATGAPAAAIHVAQAQANGSTTVASVTTQTVEAVVVELSNGTKLLICPL